MQSNFPLQDRGVLVTRPETQADKLCHLLRQQKALPIRFPTLAIVTLADSATHKAWLEQLSEYDLAIFISANAVEQALTLIGERLPARLKLAVVGQASAQMLTRFGHSAALMPSVDFSSAGLLALPQMQQVKGLRIIIFRGQGGRGLLADTLRERGAHVRYAEVYQRVMPKLDSTVLLKHWQQKTLHAATVTSNESLRNLYTMVGPQGQRFLCATALVTVSQRSASLAHELGFKNQILVSEQASDEAIIATLLKLF